MKKNFLNRSLLALLLSSSALVAATSNEASVAEHPIQAEYPVQAPAQMVPATAPIGIFTERDAGTPISIPMNKKFRVRLTTDSKSDPIGSFWRPAAGNNDSLNFQLFLTNRNTDNWHNQNSVYQISNVLFVYKALAVGSTQLSFELVQWPFVAATVTISGAPLVLEPTVLRTVTFPLTVVAADSNNNGAGDNSEATNEGSTGSLSGDLSSGSW